MSLTAMESQTKESTPSSIERRFVCLSVYMSSVCVGFVCVPLFMHACICAYIIVVLGTFDLFFIQYIRKRRRWSNDNGTESLTRLCNLAATLTAHSNKAELENPSLKSDEENSKEQDSLSEFLEDSFLDHSSIIQCLNDSFDDFASPSDSTVTDIQPPTLHKVTNQNKLNTTTTCTNVNKPTSTAIPCSQQANTHSPTTSGISHSQGIKKSMDHHVGIKTRSHCPVTLTRKNHHNGSAVSPGIAQSSMENPQNSPSRLFPNSTTGSIIQKTHHNHQDRHTQCLSSHPHSIRPNSTVSSHSSSFKPQTAINSAFKPTHSSHPSNNKINYSSLQFNEIKGKRRASPSPVAPLKGSSNAQQKPIGGTSNDAKDNESETDDDDFWTKVALSVDELEEEEEAKTDDNGDELLASLDKSAIDKLFTFDDYIENKEPLKQSMR